MNVEEAKKKIQDAAEYLQKHRMDTSLSGHFDTVSGVFADSVSEAVDVILNELIEDGESK